MSKEKTLSFTARLLRAGFSLMSLATVVSASVWDPSAHPLGRCLFRAWTDLPCFTCGLSRSYALSGRLHFREAFSYHPFGIILWLFLIMITAYYAMEAWTGRAMVQRSVSRWWQALLIILLLWVGFGLGRLGWYLLHSSPTV